MDVREDVLPRQPPLFRLVRFLRAKERRIELIRVVRETCVLQPSCHYHRLRDPAHQVHHRHWHVLIGDVVVRAGANVGVP